MPSSLSIVKNISRAVAAALVIVLCSLAFAATALPQRAFADEGVCTVSIYADEAGTRSLLPDGATEVVLPDVATAVSKINEQADNSLLKRIDVDLTCDWDTKEAGRIIVGQGKILNLNLHGHMINRAKAGSYGSPWYAEGEGEVIHVKKGATLNLVGSSNDSEAAIEHKGSLADEDCWWRYDGTGSAVLYGGLITGGACDDHYGAGGIAASGKGTTVNLSNVTVAGNLTDQWDSSYGHGAGVAIHGNDSSLTVKNSRIVYNHAEGYGGGIYVREDGTSVTIQNSQIQNNLGVLSGGGIYTDDDSVSVQVNDSVISGNRTHDDGGGIFTKGNGLLWLDNSKCISNYAQDKGGGIYYNGDSGTMIIRNASYVSKNTADDDGGGIYHNGKKGHVGVYAGSYVSENSADDGGGIYTFYDGTTFTFTSSFLNSNTASANGGGFYGNDTSIVTLEKDSKVDSNKASKGAGLFFDDGCTLNIDGSQIINNVASLNGGGVAFDDGSFYRYVVQKYINFSNNGCVSNNKASSSGKGGGIFIYDDEPTITSDGTGVVEGNEAGYGAGIYAQPHHKDIVTKRFSVENLTVKNNKAGDAGGGMYVRGLTTLRNMTVVDNYANSWGAGIYVGNTSDEDVILEKKITVENNYTPDSKLKNGQSNIRIGSYNDSKIHVLKGGSGDNALTADSHFGITLNIWVGYARKIIEGDDFFTNLKEGDKWKDVVFADWSEKFDVEYAVEKGESSSTPYLYTIIKESSDKPTINDVTVTAYGYSGESDEPLQKTYTVKSGSLVQLDSADFKKTVKVGDEEIVCPLVSWTVEFKDSEKGSSTITPDSSGITRLTPSQDVVAHANYAQAVIGVSATLDDSRTWDELGNAEGLAVSSLAFTTSDGQVHEASEDQLKSITGSTIVTEGADKIKHVVCSMTAPSSTIAKIADGALLKSQNYLKTKSAVYSSGEYGDFEVEGDAVNVSLADEADNTLTLTFAVDIQGDYTVTFDSDGGEQSYAAQKVKPGGTATYPGNVQKKGYVFQGWKLKDTSADAAGGAAEAAVASTADADDGSGTVGLYDFLTPVTGDIALIAAWDKADDEEYIDPDEDKPDEKVDPDADDDIDDDDDDIDDDDDDDGDDYFEYVASADVALPAVAEGAELPSKATASLCDSRGRVLASVSASLSWRKADGTALAGGTKAQAGERYVVEAVIPRSANPYVYPYSRTSVTFNGQAAACKSGPDGAWRLSAIFEVTAAGAFDGATLTLPKVTYVYTGSAVKPDVTVTAYGRKLAEGADYTVSYGANTAVGQAVVTVTGTGAYSGQMSASFSIVPAKVTGLAARAVKAKGKVRLAWDRRSAQTAGFEVCWATSKARLAKGKYAGTRTVKKASAKSCAAKGLKGGKRYWFKVRAYKVVGGRCYLSAWSKVRSAKAR